VTTSASAGRPRDPGLDDAILRATTELLVNHGPAGTTVEAVARAAGTSKAAVYRRWPGKNDLIVAAVRSLSRPPSVPDTGVLRDDLLTCALRYARVDPRAIGVLRGVLGEAMQDAALGTAAYETLGRPPAQAIEDVLRRAVERGELPADAPVDLVAPIVPSMAFRTLLTWGRPLTEETVVDLVDRVMLPALTR
jgi:AcrR family transcriptional regulator